MLCYGNWYQINNDFYSNIRDKVNNAPLSELELPDCGENMHEGTYNEIAALSSVNFVLLDKKDYLVPRYGTSRIEPCDIITQNKELIHIKKNDSSSKLSHLFAQGLVSAKFLNGDLGFRNYINGLVNESFGENFITEEDSNEDFEIVFAIIDKKEGTLVDNLPFFSMVNLAQILEQLKSMDYKYSLIKINVTKQEQLSLF